MRRHLNTELKAKKGGELRRGGSIIKKRVRGLLITFLLLVFCSLFPTPIFAQTEFEEEERSERLEKIKETFGKLEEPEKIRAAKKFALEYSASLSQGYDSNVNLSSPRKGDLFTGQEFSLSCRRPLSESNQLELRFGVYNIVYHEYTENNCFDNELGLELESKLSDRLTLYTSYNVGYIQYPRDNLYDYLSNEASLALRHRLSERLYHKIAYSYQRQWFDELKRRDALGEPLNGERQDEEHDLRWDWAVLFKRDFLRISNQCRLHNSNDSYFDYYDYLSYEVSVTWLGAITEKLNSLLRVGQRRRNYERRLVSELSKAQYDDTLSVTVLLYYELFPSFYLTSRFIYLDNNSNSPLYEHVERLTSVGINYRF